VETSTDNLFKADLVKNIVTPAFKYRHISEMGQYWTIIICRFKRRVDKPKAHPPMTPDGGCAFGLSTLHLSKKPVFFSVVYDVCKEYKVAKHDSPLNIVQQKKKNILKVARAHGLVNIRIFGSVIRDEATPHSDIDLLVDLEKGRSLLDLGGASIKLQELLGRKVDIVTERGLHWYLRDKILKEARPL
jgi:predicted nucleotidyltransferase